MHDLTRKLSDIIAYALPKNYTSVSYAIWKDGSLLACDALGTQGGKDKQPATVDCTYNVASVSKIYCTVAVMQLVEKGLLDLDRPVCEYLPRLTMLDDRYTGITLRHCLSHTSGLPGTQWKGFSVADTRTADYYADVYDYLAHSHLKADPGEYAVYCNDGFTLAEMAVAAVTGEKYEDYCRTHITEPIGAPSSRLSGDRNPDYPLVTEGKGPAELLLIQGGAGYTTSMKDLCTFGRIFLEENAILSESSKAEMARKQGRTFLKLDRRSENYGLGWDTVAFEHPQYDLGEGVLVKGGNSFQFTTQFIIIPKYNTVLAISETHDCRLDVQETILRLFATALWETEGVSIYKNYKPVPQAMIDEYAGTWLIPSGIVNLHLYGAHATITMDDTRGGHRPWMQTLHFDGEIFRSQDGRTLCFENYENDRFALSENNGLVAPLAQKATAGPALSAAWLDRMGKKYILVDANTYDIVLNDIVTSFKVAPLQDIEGVVMLSFSGRSDSGVYDIFEAAVKPLTDDIATGFLRTPGNPSRDLMSPCFECREGVEYCKVASFTYRDADSLPLYEGQGFDAPAAENKVYRLPYTLSKLPFIPADRRLLLLNEDMVCVYDSLCHPDFTPLDKGYILFV